MFDCIKKIFYAIDPFYTVEKNVEKNLLILSPKNKNYPITSTFIFLHGLGDDGQGNLEIFQSSKRPVPNNCRVILPTAPLAPVSLNMGEEMHSWFDIQNLESEDGISKEEFLKNSDLIISLVHEEAKFHNGHYEKIFVGGFSQGACIALNVGLNIEQNIGGIIALSGILLPFCTTHVNVKQKLELPIYIGHGISDMMINIELARKSYSFFDQNKFKFVSYNEFEINHTINSQELKDVSEFININTIKYYC